VVAIVGILAALAIYGVRKYIANSKTAEARNSIGQMSKDATTAYAREGMQASVLALGTSTDVVNRLCGSATATVPAGIASVKGKKFQSSPQDWTTGDKDNGWACVKFSMTDPQYYARLREAFTAKKRIVVQTLEEVEFQVYDSDSAFYVWARIPEGFEDAVQLNEMLIERTAVAGVPGSAFADSDNWNNYMRLCIAREDQVLQGALDRLQSALVPTSRR